MNPVIEMKRHWFRELKERDPKKYREILDYECPEVYGLPCFRYTRSCPNHTCEQCWKEALGNE